MKLKKRRLKKKKFELPFPDVIMRKEILCPVDNFPIDFQVLSGEVTGKKTGWANGKCINCGLFLYGIIDINKIEKGDKK
jgi:hypothetical protein